MQLKASSIVFRYNKKNFETVKINAEPEGAQRVKFCINTFDIVVPPTTLPYSEGLLNTHMNLTGFIAADGVTTQETYTYNVSDLENNTVGTIQYILNYVDVGINSLHSTVFIASGVFAGYTGAQVNETFDNVTGDRLITISRYDDACGC